MLIEVITWQGATFSLEWVPSYTPVPDALVKQVSGLCFTEDGRIVLISRDGLEWGLPGGHPEPGEQWPETVQREVTEEACCTVLNTQYLGAQKVVDSTGQVTYQLRYWCLVNTNAFVENSEASQRELVPPNEFLRRLSYGHGRIAAEMFSLGMECFARNRK